MSCFLGFINRRKEQLKKEDEIDEHIISNKSYERCGDKLAKYFLKMRKLNRKQFDESYDASIWEKNSVVNTHMNQLDEHFKRIGSRLKNGEDICSFIDDIDDIDDNDNIKIKN